MHSRALLAYKVQVNWTVIISLDEVEIYQWHLTHSSRDNIISYEKGYS